MATPVDLAAALAGISEHWRPLTVATLNDYGLQAQALGGTKLAERYTKAVEPKAPTGDKVSVNVSADQQPKSWSKISSMPCIRRPNPSTSILPRQNQLTHLP